MSAQREWLDHRAACAACQQVDESRTATLANLCPLGAPLFKRQLATVRQSRAEQSETRVSKEELRRRMRYVGDGA